MRSIYQIYNTLNVRHRKTENRFIWKQRKLSLFPFLRLADLSRDYRFSQSRATAATLHPPLLIEVRQKRCLLNTFVTNLNFNPEGVSAVLQRAGGWLLKKNLCTSVISFFYTERNNLSKPDKTQFEFTGSGLVDHTLQSSMDMGTILWFIFLFDSALFNFS